RLSGAARRREQHHEQPDQQGQDDVTSSQLPVPPLGWFAPVVSRQGGNRCRPSYRAKRKHLRALSCSSEDTLAPSSPAQGKPRRKLAFHPLKLAGAQRP